MKIQEYLSQKKELYSFFLSIFDNESNENSDYYFENLIFYIETNKIFENREEFKEFLLLVELISRDHHRYTQFFDKIEQIILYFQDSIKQTFSNLEIFNIFKNDKRILLFLIENETIKVDCDDILNSILKSQNRHFLYEKIKFFIDAKLQKEIENELRIIDGNIFIDFEEKCKIGENDSFICSLIRTDSVEEFIIYVNKRNIKLSSKIQNSIFETNSFLLTNKPTLIEYAAFFGSIQIFQYLRFNNVKLTSSLWLYAIHGRNADIIHILEESHVEPEDDSYQKYLEESIKCHHNDIANYIQNTLISKKINHDDESHLLLLSDDEYNIFNDENKFGECIEAYSFHYLNYEFFPSDLNNEFDIFYLCQYNYVTLVELLLNTRKLDLHKKIIQ